MKTCQSCTRPVSVRPASTRARTIAAVWVLRMIRGPAAGVDQAAAGRRQQEDRNLSREADQPEQYGRAIEAIDEPGLGDRLHPGADQREEPSTEEEAVITVREGTQHGMPVRSGNYGHPAASACHIGLALKARLCRFFSRLPLR